MFQISANLKGSFSYTVNHLNMAGRKKKTDELELLIKENEKGLDL